MTTTLTILSLLYDALWSFLAFHIPNLFPLDLYFHLCTLTSAVCCYGALTNSPRLLHIFTLYLLLTLALSLLPLLTLTITLAHPKIQQTLCTLFPTSPSTPHPREMGDEVLLLGLERGERECRVFVRVVGMVVAMVWVLGGVARVEVVRGVRREMRAGEKRVVVGEMEKGEKGQVKC
ncbi:hypothetical protein EX30DRAFT_343341 [Ascodesmis nigricans]|uniref:Uncharacterized protein n=1 Tax=Ascodesmis nigricans TaxID=341454 RepID=A0A4S2MMT5_9PEZI|nr:hypothetical protein EX30DRAFT_343341 [Ascodesmis nigricans]